MTVLRMLSLFACFMTSRAMAAEPAQDWPWFLGPTHDGTSPQSITVEPWPAEGPAIVWKKTVGEGYSAPSIRGDRLVVHHRERRQDVVECLDAKTGESRWRFAYATDFTDPFGYNGGPRCTPLLTETRCYTFGAQGKLYALELETGKVVWHVDCKEKWTIPDHFFGFGCTPLLEDNKLIVMVGGQPNSGVVAFDPETGKVLWESVGKQTWDGVSDGRAPYEWTGEEMVVSYSSPFAATIHGRRHLLCLMRQGLVSLDPATGREHFKYWFRSRLHESVNAARPVVVGSQILLSAAYDTGSALLEIQPDGKAVKELYRDRRGLSTHWSTPNYLDGHYYGFSGRHENEARLQCRDWKTGELLWETTGFAGDLGDLEVDQESGKIRSSKTGKPVPWPFYGRGSATLVGNRLIVLGERGTLALVEANPKEFKELCRTSLADLKYPTWTAPVLVGDRLYLRDEDSLICLQLKTTSK